LLIWLTEKDIIKKNAMTAKAKEAIEKPLLNYLPAAL